MAPTPNPRFRRSLELYDRAMQLFPYGTQLWSRSPRLGPFGQAPIYFDRAKGAHVWDIDGNEFIDTAMAMGPITLGYCYDAVDAAAKAMIDRGVIGSLNHKIEIEMAELIGSIIPCGEMFKFCKGGGDADAIAIRLARGYTGKDIVLFCGYHGWHDWYISANLGGGTTLDSHLLPGLNPKGVPSQLKGTSLPFEYNNLDSLKKQLEANKGKVAAIIMEATRFAEPKPGYLQGVRALADEHAAVLIFDEVVTGFRMEGGSAQKYYGVTPDLATLGKAIANGYPLAAVAGKRKIMESQGDNFISSTYYSDTVALAAGVATLKELQAKNVIKANDAAGAKLQAGINAAAQKHGVKAKTMGHASHFSVSFDYGPETAKIVTLYSQEMMARNIFHIGFFYLCLGHGDKEVAAILAAVDESLAVVAKAIKEGNVDTVLKAPVKAAGFKRMV